MDSSSEGPLTCPTCGGELSAEDRLAGLCPRCLLGLGISAETSAPTAALETKESATLVVAARDKGRRRAALLPGSSPRMVTEIAALLRSRLRVVALIVLCGVGLFLLRDLIFQQQWYGVWVRVGVLVAYAAAATLLYSRRSLTLWQLRGMEVALLWLLAGWLAVDRSHYTHVAAIQSDATALLYAIDFCVLAFFTFVTAYGMFIPNTGRRALAMSAALASMPAAILAALAVSYPDDWRFIRQTMSGVHFTSMALMLVIGAAIAVAGSHRIHSLQQQAFEARQLGQYRLIEKIGSGGMGEVWKAEHRLLVRPAAVKLIKPEMVGASNRQRAEAMLHSFEREAQATASLRSVHTVELYDFGVAEGSVFYYVMELLDGLDLERLVRRHGPLQPERAAHLFLQICDSLADAHDQGLIHRDIKPANIYACHMGCSYDFVKVLDFGLVKAGGDDIGAGRGGSIDARRQRLAGTPGYMAPEVLRGVGQIDRRVDIYALGCVGYWLLSGEQVFVGDTMEQIVAQHLGASPVPPSQRLGREIPEPFESLVLACLEKDPGARPQGAEQAASMLSRCDLAARWSQEKARAWWREHGPTPGGLQLIRR